MNEYLWDRSDSPDPEVARLEAVLAQYRAPSDIVPEFCVAPRSQPFVFHPLPFMFVALASILIAVALLPLVHMLKGVPRDAFEFSVVSGSPTINDRPAIRGVIAVGETLRTRAAERARLRIADIGWLEVEPNSIVSIIESRTGRRRLHLERGEIRARINAPPAVFIVETPSARAVDLGCAYILTVSPSGEGELRVTDGWVSLDRGLRQSLVPAGSMASLATEGRISPPYSQTTTAAFRYALLSWWRDEDVSEMDRRDATVAVLQEAKKADALSLLNLIGRASSRSERSLIYDRLTELVPAPRGVSREAVISGDRNATEAWWPVVERDLGLSRLKKTGPLNIGVYGL